MKVVAISIVLISFSLSVLAQDNAQVARTLFDKGKYQQALSIYLQLLEEYPGDPYYNYYAGRSLLKLNKQPEQCRSYLFKASTVLGPEDALFYYAQSNLFTYHLDEAEKSLKQFSHQLNFLEKMNYDLKGFEESIATAKKLTRHFLKPEASKLKSGKFNHFIIAYNKLTTGYELIHPDKNEMIEYGISSAGNFPWILPAGKFKRTFLTGVKGLKTTGTDIYEMAENEDFQAKEVIPLNKTVNSKHDEQLAWLDRESNYLYFSSAGHKSMGGLDVYRSKYDPRTNTWGNPEHLAFPLNSPHDDLILPGANEGSFVLITNRNVGKPRWEWYDIEISSWETNHADQLSAEEMQAMADFNYQIDDLNESESTTVFADQPNKTSGLVHSGDVEIEERYNNIVDKALDLQLRADSLFRLAEEKRHAMKIENDRFKRIKLSDEVRELEEAAQKVQSDANANFTAAREIEENDLTLEHTDDKGSGEGHLKLPSKVIRDRLSGNDGQTSNAKDAYVLNEFEIRTYSPYNQNNPIPMGYPLPKGLLYRIQLGVFSQHVPNDKFGGIVPITGEIISQNTYKKFYAGLFSRISDAEKALYQLKALGYSDAFIVSWFNGRKVSVNRAEDIEKSLY